MTLKRKLVIGTRRSKLALWQTAHIRGCLKTTAPELEIEVREISTLGDKSQAAGKPLPDIGGKGLFTAELEQELEAGTIDLAVHSLKDLPTEMSPIFVLGAICSRNHASDALISQSGAVLSELPAGAVIGTSSVRRAAQIKNVRPDLKTLSIRGNVETRIAKLHDQSLGYDAIVLAEAGVRRLERGEEITQILTEKEMLPAPGQGALAVQCRAEDTFLRSLLEEIDDQAARAETCAERAFLETLDGGCSTPVACRARYIEGQLLFRGRCLSPCGSEKIEMSGQDSAEAAVQLGKKMGEIALEGGFKELISSESLSLPAAESA